tara:strand:- start:404 stop:523 length:120 start_codon:yes stop_codon:yes gene_type:complete
MRKPKKKVFVFFPVFAVSGATLPDAYKSIPSRFFTGAAP